MTDDKLRVHLMIALHKRCLAEWARRRSNGAVAITQHGLDTHRDVANHLLPVVRGLAKEIAEEAEEAVELSVGQRIEIDFAAVVGHPDPLNPDLRWHPGVVKFVDPRGATIEMPGSSTDPWFVRRSAWPSCVRAR